MVAPIIGAWTLLRLLNLMLGGRKIHPRDLKLRNAQIVVGVVQNVLQAMLLVAWMARRTGDSQSPGAKGASVALRWLGVAYSVMDIYLSTRRYERRSRNTTADDAISLIALINDRRLLELSAASMAVSFAILLYDVYDIGARAATRGLSRRERR